MLNMANITIGKKLIAGFSAVAGITLILGALGYYGLSKSTRAIEEIANNQLPGVQSLLVISENGERIKAALRTLLNADAKDADRKRQPETIAKAQEGCKAAWDVYQSLPHTSEDAAAWNEFVSAWEQWCKDNDELLKINAEREAMQDVYSRRAKSPDISYRQALVQLFRSAGNALALFKVQVQEWKNILLRGNDPAKYDKHFAAFEQDEKKAQEELKRIVDLLRQLGLDSKSAEDTAQKHAALGTRYREALKKFDKSNPNAGQEIDRMVTGIDRPAAESIDKIAAMTIESAERFNDVMNRLDRQAMTVCHSSELKALGLLHKIVDINKERAKSISTSARTQAGFLQFASLIAMVISVALALGLGIVISRGITGPIRRAASMVQDISEDGDLTRRLTVVSQDEIGRMATCFNRFVEKLQGTIGHIAGDATTVASSATELSATATQLAGGAEETTNQSAQVAVAAEQLSTNMTTMAASTEQMSANVKVVSNAIEEVNVSVREIAQSAESASAAASNAAELVDSSNSQIGKLRDAAEEIGKVIEVIQDIAEQTNLLALNATIEAARAGEAGKGFAVVATEVKELAKQTAGATEDIRQRVEGIQGSTGLTVKSMSGISDVIRQVNELSRMIASAVEEQSITTKEIARNIAQSSTAAQTVAKGVTESAEASHEIARIVVGVDQAAKQTAQGASQTQTTGHELSTVAEQLRSLVGQFKV